MLFNKQLFKHDPANGSFGDCYRTAIACVLNKLPEEVPNFGVHWDDGDTFHDSAVQYLKSINLGLSAFGFNDTELEQLLAELAISCKNLYILFSGVSRNGTNHTVVVYNGEIIWDPAIDNSGIVGPTLEGYYMAEFLVPLEY